MMNFIKLSSTSAVWWLNAILSIGNENQTSDQNVAQVKVMLELLSHPNQLSEELSFAENEQQSAFCSFM